MNRILKAVKLDFYSAKSFAPTLGILCVANFIFTFLLAAPINAIQTGMIFAIIPGGMVFTAHEGRHAKLYGILPLQKYEVVVSRYISGAIIGVVNLLISCAFVYIVLLGHPGIFLTPGAGIWPMAMCMFIYYCLSVSIAYPLYFAFGFRRTVLVTIFPLMLIGLLVSYLLVSSPLYSEDWLSRHQLFTGPHLFASIIVVILVCLALLAASALISYAIYKRKEL